MVNPGQVLTSPCLSFFRRMRWVSRHKCPQPSLALRKALCVVHVYCPLFLGQAAHTCLTDPQDQVTVVAAKITAHAWPLSTSRSSQLQSCRWPWLLFPCDNSQGQSLSPSLPLVANKLGPAPALNRSIKETKQQWRPVKRRYIVNMTMLGERGKGKFSNCHAHLGVWTQNSGLNEGKTCV